jgi:alpha-tubulin suppressor-like RCC1 family protein
LKASVVVVVAVGSAGCSALWGFEDAALADPDLPPRGMVASVAAGLSHTCAVTTRGAAKCWGSNTYGELGNDSAIDSSVAVEVVGLSSGVAAITSGNRHTCALMTSGAVKCWGRNANGELGNDSRTHSAVPTDVDLAADVVSISAGASHTCAATAGGAVMCWGHNEYGQLGNDTTVSSGVPVTVIGLGSGAATVAAGAYHACAVTTGGAVKCWGRNLFGQLGNASTVDARVPVDVAGLGSGVASISAGSSHTCALTNGGNIECWGSNGKGRLGNDSPRNSSTPVDVVDPGEMFTGISAGLEHTCALTTVGGVRCWGRNLFGELGEGSTTNRSVPVSAIGLDRGVTGVSAGGYHTCALVSAGRVKCWGYNAYGQLGNDSNTNSSVPVDVVGL